MFRDVQFLSFRRMMGYGTTEIRCVQPTRALRSAGVSADADYIFSAPASRCRLMVLHRVRLDDLTRRIILLARKRGTRLVYDTDDLIPDDGDAERFAPDIVKAMQLADMVTVSGSYLKTIAARSHDNCRIVRNRLSREFLDKGEIAVSEKRARGEQVTIGYLSGSNHHDADLAMIAPQLAEVLERNSNAVLLIAGKINVNPVLKAFGPRVRIEPFRPYTEFPELLREIDINLCPLDLSSGLARARSELKFIEAAAFGIPTVASPSDAYREAIVNGESGFLSQTEGWATVVEALVKNPDLRHSVGQRARADVTRDYGPEACIADWQDILATLCDPAQSMRLGPTDLADAASVQARTILRKGRMALKRRLRHRTFEKTTALGVAP